MATMMQGDQYYIPISGTGFELAAVEYIEFVVGKLVKSYPKDVSFNEANSVFLFPVTQAETFRMTGTQQTQARVKFKSSEDVIGVAMESIEVSRSLTRTVL